MFLRKRFRENVYERKPATASINKERRTGGRDGVIRAVLVGCGAMSKAWLDAARQIEGLEIVGLVDIDVGRARSRAAQFQLDSAVTGDDLDAVLEAVKPDLVFDVAVPDARASVAASALRHGCHLLTEKPLAPSMEVGRAIVDGARAANRLHAVVQNRRYLAAVRRRPTSTATSSSAPILAASARRWTTSCFSTWQSIPSMPRAR
jgi:Oxidoreductase family, NAD-binding Rossmann fold